MSNRNTSFFSITGHFANYWFFASVSEQRSALCLIETLPFLNYGTSLDDTLWLSFVANSSPVSSCSLAVGLEDRKRVPDVAFSASSTLTRAHSPSRARLHIQVGNQQAAGWAPRLDDSTPWLQVDLGARMTITGIGTQGGRYFWWSFGGWVVKFKVSFKISDKGWKIYAKNTSGEARKVHKRLIIHAKLELSGYRRGMCHVGLSKLTNRSHVSVRLFSNRSHRWHQNVVRTSINTRLLPCVPHFCSWRILTSVEVYYWTDARQPGVYLF